jgi:hypothetical protein
MSLMRNPMAPLGELISGTASYYPEPLLKVH